MSDIEAKAANADQAGETPELPSKTRIKQQMADLRDLGQEIVELPDARVKQMPMSEKLGDAVMLCRKVTAHGGRKRQLQYIGKLLRDEPEENLAGIKAKLAAFAGESNAENARFHGMERWRDRLLQDDAAVAAFITTYPNTESQRLRQLLREARKDAVLGKPPKHSRELFKLIRETIEGAETA
jgi:ribosome-associated protein